MIDNKAIIEKIKKLNAKANDESVSENEAALFMKKVIDLLAQHNLDAAVLNEETVVLAIDEEIYPTPYAHVYWYQVLFCAVSNLFFCKGLVRTTYKNNNKRKINLFIVGKEHNRAIALSMFAYLTKTVVRLSKAYSKITLERYHFEKGAGLRLSVRVHDEIKKTEVHVPGTANLPALYSMELALVDQFLSDVKWAKERKTSIKFNEAAIAGNNAAKNISLNNQIGGARANAFLIGK